MSTGMENIFIGRQPIYDRSLQVQGYELLFRHRDAGHANIIDGNGATSQVILNAFTVLGLERVCGTLPAYINVTGDFLVSHAELPFPVDRVVLEVLENVRVDEQLLEVVGGLKRRGFTLALDDFVWTEDTARLLPLAQVVKVDVLGKDRAAIEATLERLAPYRVRLLAEKVEDQDQFELCRALGFELFQGFFLSRPSNLAASSIATNRLPILRLLSVLYRSDVEIDELERLIAQDVSLSYKLLRYLNSAFFNLRREIDSIRQAIVYLGIRELRIWASLVAMAAVPDKPQALMTTLMIRARMCELVAQALGNADASTCFTVGLFSGLDALFDAPLADILVELPLSGETREALLHGSGAAGRVLDWALAYEAGDWGRISAQDGPVDTLRQAYLEAVAWSEEVARLFHDPV